MRSILTIITCAVCVACSGAPSDDSTPGPYDPDPGTVGPYDPDAAPPGTPFSAPTFIAASLHRPRPLTADDARVYFGTDDGHVYSVTFDGSGLTSLATEENSIDDVRVDDDAVYWSSHGNIRKVAKSGGAPVTLATHDSLDWIRLALGPGDVYWTIGHPPSGMVRKVAKAGGPIADLATGLDTPSGIAVDADGIYFATNGDGTIRAMSLDGTNPRALAVGQDSPHAVFVDGDRVYWTTERRVASVAKAGGEPVSHAPPHRSSPQWVITDATHVYYSNTDGGAVERVPKAGGAMEVLVQMGDTMYGIAVVDRALFFASTDSGVVGRVTW